MKIIKVFILIPSLFFVLLINGCSGTKESTTSAKIEGIEWKLETLNGKTVSLKSASSITLNLNGTSAKISGTAVCNSYFGGYTKTGDAIVFSGIGSTKMMCDDNLNESDYFSMLSSADSYKTSGGKLTLMSKGAAVAVFGK